MLVSLPDLALLQTFLCVAEHRSISQAAQALELTQPAVTKQVRRLEDSLGLSLIDRNARPLQLTEAGGVLVDRAPDLLSQARRLADDIREMSAAGLPLLRIGMTDSLSEVMGAEFIGAMQSYAHVVELKSGISPWLETAFRARHFDLLVDSPPFTETEQVEQQVLFHDPFVVVAPPSLADVPLDMLVARENYVGYGRSSKFGAACSAQVTALGVERTTRFNFDSTQSLLRFVQAGYGWAVTSAICLMQSPIAANEVVVHRHPSMAVRDFHLLNRRGELGGISQEARDRFLHVFGQLLNGPWETVAPCTAELLLETNRAT